MHTDDTLSKLMSSTDRIKYALNTALYNYCQQSTFSWCAMSHQVSSDYEHTAHQNLFPFADKEEML